MVDKINNVIIKKELPKTEIAKIQNSNISKIQKENEVIEVLRKKRLESMTDEEIIEENLRSILDTKSREERKANGRLIAVLVAFLLIFLAIYHAWIRKTAVLAGVLVPAAIMLGYGGWVVVLAKRDKRKRAIFKKQLEEVAIKNKIELEKKAAAIQKSKSEEKCQKGSTSTTVRFEDEITKKNDRKERKRKRNRADKQMALTTLMMKEESNSSTRQPGVKQKLFGQNEVLGVHGKRKDFKRMDTLPLPNIVRISSVP